MKFTSINEYVSTLPENAQKAMGEIIATIKDVVPDAEEHISYNMPAFKVNGEYFVHFSAWKNHIGTHGNEVYPNRRLTARAISFGEEFAQFPSR